MRHTEIPILSCPSTKSTIRLASYPGPFNFAHGGPGMRKTSSDVTFDQRGCVHGNPP